jgi:hypothetical protein
MSVTLNCGIVTSSSVNWHYQTFKLKNCELLFTVDVSKLLCDISGGLSFVSKDEDGGFAKSPVLNMV